MYIPIVYQLRLKIDYLLPKKAINKFSKWNQYRVSKNDIVANESDGNLFIINSFSRVNVELVSNTIYQWYNYCCSRLASVLMIINIEKYI